jgi:hypothetical protein
MNKCPKCDADEMDGDSLVLGLHSRFNCGSGYTTESRFIETAQCLRRQLATVTAERDAWKESCNEQIELVLKFAAERDRLRELIRSEFNL